ncbi:DNA internalization-related competence protein ComEC/Rec2 [Dongshaea marina]|uniref:DNA internalization-related competence protein ComEC/Rec2 n=1 Tax=Dongshaea marina TaxID=2047966 RepID=UPI00131F3C4A|nr:DNA internalization-related competence protein ComEC/Rec2 [Dongshaea marina]
MDRTLILLAVGATLVALISPWLTPWWAVVAIPLLLVVAWSLPWLRAPCLLLCGALSASAMIDWRLGALSLPEPSRKGTQMVSGQVVDIQYKNDSSGRLTLRATSVDEQHFSSLRPLYLRLSWYDSEQTIEAGWKLTVATRLRPVYGIANPAGFDYPRWLYSRGIGATGTIKEWQAIVPQHPGFRLDWLNRVRELTRGFSSQGIILALSFGDRRFINDSDWQLYREAGISHLLAISGLHIGLVALAGWWLGRGLGRYGPYLVAAALAISYAWLAGFTLPTQRALLMLLILSGVTLCQRYWPPWRYLLWTYLLLVLFDPLQLLNAGFWLSFGAVSVILVTHWLYPRSGLVGIQLGLLLGLLPLQVLFFDGVSWVALFINLLLIPLFTLLVIPGVLLATGCSLLWPALSSWLFYGADKLLSGVHLALGGLQSQLPLWLPFSWEWVMVIVAVVFLLSCWRLKMHLPMVVGVACLLLSCFSPGPGWQVRVLDVGQGLAVMVIKEGRALLYDTGNAYPGGFSYAQAVILPTLRKAGVDRLDYLILSHRDRDHAGGAAFLAGKVKIGEHIGSWRAQGKRLCRAGQRFEWQGLSVAILHPGKPGRGIMRTPAYYR